MGARPGALIKSAALAILRAVKHREHDSFVTIPRQFVEDSIRACYELACTLIKAGTSHMYQCGGGQTAHPLAYTANNLRGRARVTLFDPSVDAVQAGLYRLANRCVAMRRQLRANSGLLHRSKKHLYSITSLARASSVMGQVRPPVSWRSRGSILTVCWNGRPAGLVPLRISHVSSDKINTH
jgi:hypothetical protein